MTMALTRKRRRDGRGRCRRRRPTERERRADGAQGDRPGRQAHGGESRRRDHTDEV